MAEHYKGATAPQTKKSHRKHLIWIALGVTAAYLVVMLVSHQLDQQMKTKEAHQQAVAAAATLRLEQQDLVRELEAESAAANQVKASALSKEYRDAYDAAQAKSGQGAPAVVWTPPGFNASIYGYTGVDQLPYYQSINSDTVGWLRVPGTNINHAVVQNTQDVNYYTAKGYDKGYSYYGVIWTNPSTTTSSSNTVLYGHNWTNYSAAPRIGYSGDIMFAQLTGYHYLSMAQSYPYIYYSTPGDQGTYVIFACFYTEPAFQYNVAEGDMNYIINEARARSRHTFNVDVNASDKLLTLSTCTRAYGATSNQRFVVMARRLRPGETITEVGVTSNPGHKQPSVW